MVHENARFLLSHPVYDSLLGKWYLRCVFVVGVFVRFHCNSVRYYTRQHHRTTSIKQCWISCF